LKHSLDRKQSKITYRPDIDGLRAIAVTMVILFHFWPEMLPGGFVGVDIFFVISGYLITSIIYKQKIEATFSFKNFYLHRMKRILPAFFAMLIFTYILAFIFLLPDDLKSFVKTTVASAAYYSNFYFMIHAEDYFAHNSLELPLLHTWSLSVEEQYYLLWPIVLSVIVKCTNKKVTYLSMFLIFIASLMFSINGINFNEKEAYFSIFSRIFEFMIGSFFGIYLFHKLETAPCKREKSFIYNIIGAFGATLILFSCFYLSENDPFPGYYALFPTIGAIMIIISGSIKKPTFLKRILSNKLLVNVGVISYSLYLFHWPIISYWHYFSPEKSPSLLEGALMLLIVILASFLSYKLIEKPFRYCNISLLKCLILYQMLPFVLILSIGFLIKIQDGFPERFSKEVLLETKFPGKDYGYNSDDPVTLGDLKNTPTKVIFFGDSHGAQFAPFFDQFAKKYHFSIEMLFVGGCYPLLDSFNKLLSSDKNLANPIGCAKQINFITEHYNDYDVFILGGFYDRYIAEDKTTRDFIFLDELRNTIDFLIKHHKKVIVIGDAPQDKNVTLLYMIRRKAVFEKVNFINLLQTKVSMIKSASNKSIQALALKFSPNAYFFNTEERFFAELNTLPFYKGILIYKDADHINEYGANLIAKSYLASPNNSLEEKLKEWKVIKE
jgi:peptidoglycan/LPS O-acetylase OafA/YrhL